MPFQFSPPFPRVASTGTLAADIVATGLTSNLKLSLDAGNSLSYSSGQKWLDLSGGGYDFFVGADGSVTGSDPTFTGAAGGQSLNEYWACDGGDYFRYDTTNETWMTNLHKNNALFSFAMWVRLPTLSAPVSLFGTAGAVGAGRIGVLVRASNDGLLNFAIGVGGAGLDTIGKSGVLADQWNFLAGSYDEATSTLILFTNGTSSAPPYAITPSASAATYTMEVGAAGNAQNPVEAGARINSLAMWEGTALSAAQLLALYDRSRSRFLA